MGGAAAGAAPPGGAGGGAADARAMRSRSVVRASHTATPASSATDAGVAAPHAARKPARSWFGGGAAAAPVVGRCTASRHATAAASSGGAAAHGSGGGGGRPRGRRKAASRAALPRHCACASPAGRCFSASAHTSAELGKSPSQPASDAASSSAASERWFNPRMCDSGPDLTGALRSFARTPAHALRAEAAACFAAFASSRAASLSDFIMSARASAAAAKSASAPADRLRQKLSKR